VGDLAGVANAEAGLVDFADGVFGEQDFGGCGLQDELGVFGELAASYGVESRVWQVFDSILELLQFFFG